MIIGAIDIGTNTVRLLVSDYSNKNISSGAGNEGIGNRWCDIVREMDIARLGEGVVETHQIKPEAMERTLDILSRYKEKMDNLGVERYRVVATSAMRDAANAEDFIRLVEERIDMSIEVISGKEEGRLTFTGAMGQDSLANEDCPALVIDVGGGSTEFICGNSKEILDSVSVDIGSVRLTESFFKHDPPTKEEIHEVRREIAKIAKKAFSIVREVRPSTIIAVAGTATQLSALLYKVEPYDPMKIHGSILRLSDLETLSKQLGSMTVDERKKLIGMHPKRADVIVAGAIILEEILFELGYPMLVVSEKDILDGIAGSIISMP